jgi:hypothetical protein
MTEKLQKNSALENLERRCPRLGSPISVKYCLISGEDDGICWKILDCWWETFDVEAFLKNNMSPAEFDLLMKRAEKPANKIGSLIEIIERAKKAGKTED